MIQIPVVTFTSGYVPNEITKEAIEQHLGFKCVKSVDSVYINSNRMSYNVYFDKVEVKYSDTIKSFVTNISNKLIIKYEHFTFNLIAQNYNY